MLERAELAKDDAIEDHPDVPPSSLREVQAPHVKKRDQHIAHRKGLTDRDRQRTGVRGAARTGPGT